MESKYNIIRESIDNRVFRNETRIETISNTAAPPFQYFFRIDIRLLRLIGLSSFSTVFSTQDFTSCWWQGAYIFSGVFMIIASIFCLMHKIVCVKEELISTLETISVICSGALCMLKGLRWWTHRYLLYKILQRLSILWEIARSCHYLTPKNLETAKKAKLIRSIYTFTIVLLSSSFVIRPYIIHINHHFHRNPNNSMTYIFILSEEYGFTTESFWAYFVFLTYEQMVVFFTCIYWVSSDTLFAQLMTHMSIQFNILANRLENIIEDDVDIVHENNIDERLKEIATYHHQLYTYCHLIETLYNPVIFSTILSNGFNACCCLYVMEEQFSARNWNEISKSMFHLIVLSIQTVIYCGYTDTLIQSSTQMFHAAYDSHWLDFSRRNNTILLIIMMRAQKGYEYTVYGMIPLNLNRLTMMANGAISYFMLLRNFG